MDQKKQDESLRQTLSELGHSPEMVEVIMKKLEAYDREMLHASVFDSIENGSFDLDQIVKEAKAEVEAQQQSQQ
ncbi:MAG: hypothetical protein AAGD07_15565 [Planctomycetota bacterium]